MDYYVRIQHSFNIPLFRRVCVFFINWFVLKMKRETIFLHIVIFISLCWSQPGADLESEDAKSIWGMMDFSIFPIDLKARKRLKAKCFKGVGLSNCVPRNMRNVEDVTNALPYYATLADRPNRVYCLQCCSNTQSEDVWDMDCNVDLDQVLFINIFAQEFRLATLKTGLGYENEEDDHIRCPLVRTACEPFDYDGNDLGCSAQYDLTDANLLAKQYLWGYSMELTVVEKTENSVRWLEVTKCEVTSVEERSYSIGPGGKFHEKITILHPPVMAWPDYQTLGWMFVFLIGLSYPILYFFRKKHCIVCTKKLVWSKEKCYICKFFNADPPDPVLVAALEEHGLFQAGVAPKKFHFEQWYIKQDERPGEQHFEKERKEMKQKIKIIQKKRTEEMKSHKSSKRKNKIFDDSTISVGDSTTIDQSTFFDTLDEPSLDTLTELEEGKVHDLDELNSTIIDELEVVDDSKVEKKMWFWQRSKPKPVVPNSHALKVHPSIIYEAIGHPFPGERPLGMIPRGDDKKFGKPQALVLKNHGNYKNPKKKKVNIENKKMSYDEWVKAGKPVFDEAKAEAEVLAEIEAAEKAKKGLGPVEPKKGMMAAFGF
jgi:hypothetical protein